MTRLIVSAGLACLALVPLPARAEDDPRSDALREAREGYYRAFYRGDTDAMARWEEADLQVLHDRAAGPQSGAEWRREIRKLAEGKRWNPKRMVPETVDQEARIDGTMARVSGIGLVDSPEDEGGPKLYKAFTETWVERDGRWRLAHLHYDFRDAGVDSSKP